MSAKSLRFLLLIVVVYTLVGAAMITKAFSQTLAQPDQCGNSDFKHACLIWNYDPFRKDQKTAFTADQAKFIYIVYENQNPRKIAAPATQTFLTAACVKGNYTIAVEDLGGNIGDYSKPVFVDTTMACLGQPAAPVIRCTN